jgi:hypothetical protein
MDYVCFAIRHGYQGLRRWIHAISNPQARKSDVSASSRIVAAIRAPIRGRTAESLRQHPGFWATWTVMFFLIRLIQE